MVELGQTEVFGPSFFGAGKRPTLIPAYQLDRLMPSLSRTSGNRIKRSPVITLSFFISIFLKAHDCTSQAVSRQIGASKDLLDCLDV